MQIRLAKMEDYQELVAIELENFGPKEATSAQAIKKRLELTRDSFLVAELAGQVAGYIEGQIREQTYLTDDLFEEVAPNPETGGTIIVTSLSVAPGFQGQGLGTALLAALKDLAVARSCRGISLTCHDYLLSYYEMNGFADHGQSDSTLGSESWYNMVWENPYL